MVLLRRIWGWCDLASAVLVGCCGRFSPRADGEATSSSAHCGVPFPPSRRCRVAVSSSGDFGDGRWCVGGDDGGLGSGVWPAREVLECCELGVSRRPRFGSTVISISSEVVTAAALNAHGLGAPSAPCREVEDGGFLVCCCLYLFVYSICLCTSLFLNEYKCWLSKKKTSKHPEQSNPYSIATVSS
jgi:ferredoxin-thioredoxin reductase catalytic subunit